MVGGRNPPYIDLGGRGVPEGFRGSWMGLGKQYRVFCAESTFERVLFVYFL